jgi:hypothetical protein
MPLAPSGPFIPNNGGTVTHAVTTTSTTPTALVGSGSDLMFYNAGSSEAFMALGSSTVAASLTTSVGIAPGAYLVFGRPEGTTHVVAITAAGTATLRVTTGSGS